MHSTVKPCLGVCVIRFQTSNSNKITTVASNNGSKCSIINTFHISTVVLIVESFGVINEIWSLKYPK